MRGSCALAGFTFGAAIALATGFASAQVPYQIGDNRGNVTVDLGVMESLGPTPTVPVAVTVKLSYARTVPTGAGPPSSQVR